MLDDRLAYYQIVTTVNWDQSNWDNLNATGRVSTDTSKVDTYYSGDSSNMLVYIVRNMIDANGYDTGSTSYYSSSTVSNLSVTFSGFPTNTPIKLSWYDPSTSGGASGNSIPSADTTFSNGSISVTAPSFMRDIVAILKPE